MSAAVLARGLAAGYGGRAVVRDLALEVAPGEIFGLAGPDGAGKSTLLRVLVGELPPLAGEVRVLGARPGSPALRRAVAYMPAGYGLYPDLTVAENLDFFATLHGLGGAGRRARRAALLARVGLAGVEGRRAGALSGGMLQKLALACALVGAPRLLVLDEPTMGVDPLSRRAFWALLESVRGEGATVVVATASLEEAERCDRVGLMREGRLEAAGSPAELARVPGVRLLRVRARAPRAAAGLLAGIAGVRAVFPVGARLAVWADEGLAPETLRAALAGRGETAEVEPARPGLHEAMLWRLAAEGAGDGR